ncbi:hypothetical protein Nmel_009868, partial [Mimus melanotis]
AHYNLALSVALMWLSDSDAQTPLTREKIIPIEEIFEIYSMKPSTTHWQRSAKDHCIQPFKISLHPSAMLTAPEAAEHARKQSIKYQTLTAHQKQGPCSARRAKNDCKQLDTLTRGKQQSDKGATEAKQGISPRKPGTNSK